MCFNNISEAVQAGGGDITARLLSCGCIDMLVSALSAVEQSETPAMKPTNPFFAAPTSASPPPAAGGDD